MPHDEKVQIYYLSELLLRTGFELHLSLRSEVRLAFRGVARPRVFAVETTPSGLPTSHQPPLVPTNEQSGDYCDGDVPSSLR